MRKNQGHVLLLVAVLFTALATSAVLATASPIVSQLKMTKNLELAKRSYFTAEAATEDAVYRLRNGHTVGPTELLNLDGVTANVVVSDSVTGKEVTVEGDASDIIRKIKTSVVVGTGIAFNYGLQAGNGGVFLSGGSTINGNIYSNASIDAISSTITGSAVAADSAALSAEVANASPMPSTGSINFRNSSALQDFAQSFQMTSTAPVSKIQFYIKKTGSPANATIRIVEDYLGEPRGIEIPSGGVSLNSAQVTSNFGWVEVVFSSPPPLQPGHTYWMVLDSSNHNPNNYYTIASNTSYPDGEALVGSFSARSWSATGEDAYFNIYTGGITSYIGKATYPTGLFVGQGGVGDAWASHVQGVTVAGSLYCNTSSDTNKPCDTSRGSPSPQPFPFSMANIDEWKDLAEAGGVISGDYTVGWAGATLGPKRITGNLLVSGGGTLTLSGPLWVEGTITVTGGGNIRLPAGYGSNSEVVVSDKRITINGGGSAGSGFAGSYIFFVTTSQCPYTDGCSSSPAITVSGGAGAVAINAQYGDILLNGGADINAATGHSITISGGGTVTYDTGLASPSFVSGPSGGYQITGWEEIP